MRSQPKEYSPEIQKNYEKDKSGNLKLQNKERHSKSILCRNLNCTVMPKYVIERDFPEAGKLSAMDLQGIARKSCDVLEDMGPQIQWVNSYVTDDKIYCVYISPNEEMVREHAKQGGFPISSVSKVATIIDPVTSE